MSETPLDLRLFGAPEVTLHGLPVEVDTRKAIALLAYLAVEGSQEREALATLFWADSSADRARATLRRTLSALRAGIGPEIIEADRNRVRLLGGYRCDIAEFDAAISETASHGHDPGDVCPRCADSLARAVDLYRGDFLAGFSVKDAPEFEDWVRTVTESLRLRAGEACRRLAYARAAAGDYPAAITAAKRWISLDELHEPAHRLLMLLEAWAGDRPGAIQAYRECVAVLDRELGVAPLEETTELFEAIMDEDIPPAPGMPRPTRSHPVSEPHPTPGMVDRAGALETLRETLERSRDEAVVCFLTGASWMGKTRLLDHLTETASAGGHAVVSSTASRTEAGLPFSVAVQILEGLTQVASPGDLPEWATIELARLLPRLSSERSVADVGQLGQLRLRDAFLTMLELASGLAPTVVVVDDAQWIDTASAELVVYLVQRVTHLPLLFVISARESGTLHPGLRDLFATAGVRVSLDPLKVEDLTRDHPDVDIADIITATGGIPLLVQEALTKGEIGSESSSVLEYIESRRGRLSDLSGQVLAAASVLSGLCDPVLLRATSGRNEEEVVEAVEELVGSGLLKELDDDRLGFTLDVLERVTYESTSLIRRRLLHRRAAEALQAQARTRLNARLAAATAGHLRLAGSEEAPEWYRLAGDLARELHAPEEARLAYETAIALGHPAVGPLRLALGEMAMASGDYDRATQELQSAAAQSEEQTLAIVEHRIGELDRLLGRFDLAEESFTRAERDHPHLSDLHADWALLRHRLGDSEGATEFAERAVTEADNPVERARALNVSGLVATDPELALSRIEQALAESGLLDPARIAALNNKAHLLSNSGDQETAIGLVSEAIEIAERTGYRHHRAALLNHLADLNHRAGRRAEAERALTEAVTIFADIDSGDWRPEVWLLRQW